MALPIQTMWVLARSKVKDDKGKSYYGGYPAGFLERVRNVFLNGRKDACIWHVCGGFSRNYNVVPFWGFGENDVTIDIDSITKPTILMDVREISEHLRGRRSEPNLHTGEWNNECWIEDVRDNQQYRIPDLILIDRPYGEDEAKNYNSGPETCPDLNKLVRDCIDIAPHNCPVLCIDYYWPRPGSADKYQEYAAIAVLTGRDNKAKVLTAWRRAHPKKSRTPTE